MNAQTIYRRLSDVAHVGDRKNRYDINVHVTSATYYSQLSKRSHLQLVS